MTEENLIANMYIVGSFFVDSLLTKAVMFIMAGLWIYAYYLNSKAKLKIDTYRYETIIKKLEEYSNAKNKKH